jgi:hypothetical protein
MHNLYVVHTQYSLVLAMGLSKGRFKNDNNDLILFKDFKLIPELKNTLDANFNNSLYIEGAFPKTNSSITNRLKNFFKAIKECKKFITSKYNRVFIVLDMNLPEMRIMKMAYKLNPEVKFIALEDGSYPYFLNYVTAGGLDTNQLTRKFRKFLFKYLLGCGDFYSFEGRFMGANTWLKDIYLTYKDYARDIYANKKKVEISTEEFNSGVNLLFSGTATIISENSVLLILDKLDVYTDLNKIRLLISEMVSVSSEKGKTIYYKFHPRENMSLVELKNCIELDRSIAIESYYKTFVGQNPLVVGIKSTGLQTAKKMGFNVISLAKVVNEHNSDVISFYEKIGIKILTNLSEL